MIQFNELRQKMPPGEHVMDKKIKGVQIMIHKHKGKFDAFVDGDKLDSYRTQREAEKAAETFVTQFKAMK